MDGSVPKFYDGMITCFGSGQNNSIYLLSGGMRQGEDGQHFLTRRSWGSSINRSRQRRWSRRPLPRREGEGYRLGSDTVMELDMSIIMRLPECHSELLFLPICHQVLSPHSPPPSRHHVMSSPLPLANVVPCTVNLTATRPCGWMTMEGCEQDITLASEHNSLKQKQGKQAQSEPTLGRTNRSHSYRARFLVQRGRCLPGSTRTTTKLGLLLEQRKQW